MLLGTRLRLKKRYFRIVRLTLCEVHSKICPDKSDNAKYPKQRQKLELVCTEPGRPALSSRCWSTMSAPSTCNIKKGEPNNNPLFGLGAFIHRRKILNIFETRCADVGFTGRMCKRIFYLFICILRHFAFLAVWLHIFWYIYIYIYFCILFWRVFFPL